MFGIKNEEWFNLNGINTSREIYQQPDIWRNVLEYISENQKEIKNFLNTKLKNENAKIILTGAGSSAYIGEIVASNLNKNHKKNFFPIPTTDILQNPELYFEKDTPTILISFARSGNSPESIGVFELANKIIKDINHIIITCNKDGKLAKIGDEYQDTLLLLMPEDSNDKGFAMTSSFSSMVLASLLIFDIDNIQDNILDVGNLVLEAKYILNNKFKEIDNILNEDFNRVVYLGSAENYPLAKESSLKVLELTRGKIISTSETVLGFRHGPKSIVNDKTIIFIFLSNNLYSQKYDMDLLKEIYNDEGEHKVILVSNKLDFKNYNLDYHLNINTEKIKNKNFINLLYLLFAQIFALKASIKTNISPDNPNPSGKVNRVVKGVNIYEYKS